MGHRYINILDDHKAVSLLVILLLPAIISVKISLSAFAAKKKSNVPPGLLGWAYHTSEYRKFKYVIFYVQRNFDRDNMPLSIRFVERALCQCHIISILPLSIDFKFNNTNFFSADIRITT